MCVSSATIKMGQAQEEPDKSCICQRCGYDEEPDLFDRESELCQRCREREGRE